MTAIILPFPSPDSLWIDTHDADHNGGTASEYLCHERCIDWLLDRFQSTTDPALRRLVTDVVAEIQEVGPTGHDAELAAIVIGALASVEAAFELHATGGQV